MSRKRIILYAVFALYQTGAFIFTVMVDGHMDLLALLKYIKYFKYISLLGLALIAIDIAWFIAESRGNQKKEEELKKINGEPISRHLEYEARRTSRQA